MKAESGRDFRRLRAVRDDAGVFVSPGVCELAALSESVALPRVRIFGQKLLTREPLWFTVKCVLRTG